MTSIRSRGIAILGMHRSGTSTLAGTLRLSGVHFGQVLDEAFALNPKGLQEAPAILYMQENLLEQSGGSWHEPPSTVSWRPLHKAVRDLFVESRRSEPVWGFKDPRTLLTLEGWLDSVVGLECIGIFRHPAEVALSIHRRNQFPVEKCLDIWHRYNERLLVHRQKRDFPLVEFVNDGAEMKRAFVSALDALGISATPEALAFHDSEMKHHERPPIEVPEPQIALYRALQRLALK